MEEMGNSPIYPTLGFEKSGLHWRPSFYPQSLCLFRIPSKMPWLQSRFRFQLWRHRFHGWFPGGYFLEAWMHPIGRSPRMRLNFLYPQSEGLFLLLWCHGDVQAQITSDISTFQKRSRTNSIYKYVDGRLFKPTILLYSTPSIYLFNTRPPILSCNLWLQLLGSPCLALHINDILAPKSTPQWCLDSLRRRIVPVPIRGSVKGTIGLVVWW